MINDSFRLRYKTIPAAISIQASCYNTPLHNHEEIEVLIVDKGTSSVRIGAETLTARAGDLIFIDPMEIHSVTVEENAEYMHRCICFEPSLIFDKKISDGIKNGRLHLPMRLTEKEYPQVFALCCKMFETISNEDAASSIEAPAYISLIIGFFVRNSLLKKGTPEIKDTVCKNILEYVHNHFAENISSKTAAEALFLNQNYFCRKFSKNFGMSFSAYLNIYRISVSRKLLEDGKSVSDTAFECGFADPMYFSRCFKKYVGILPSEYRKKSI